MIGNLNGMNSKKIVPIIIIAICVIILTALIVAIINKENEFDKKVDLITSQLLQDDSIQTMDKYYAFISVSNGKNKAIIQKSSGKTVEEAINNVRKITKDFITKNNIKPIWVKMDVVNEIEEVDNIEELIEGTGEYYFKKGISFDSDFNYAFLEAELNSNNIINYLNKSISLIKLNQYLVRNNYSELSEIPDELQLFTTISYICDENSDVYELYTDEINGGRRIKDQLTKEEILEMLNNNVEFLKENILDSGKYIYGYSALTDSKFDNYNILRHAGTTWSLITLYDITNDKSLANKTKLALDYMVNEHLKQYDGNIAYIYEDEEIKIGANGLALLAFIEYMETFNTDEYVELAKQLGDGILKLQDEQTGQYTHIIDMDLNEKEKFTTVYYDGEATFGLLKLYGYTKDEKYLNAAKKAVDYFIENEYEQYSDQWLAYTSNEITKYDKNPKYFELGLKNAGENFEDMRRRPIFAPTQFELLMQTFELYERMMENNITVDYLEEFKISELLDVIKYSLDFGLNTYMYPEVAMYLDNPSDYVYIFYVRNAAFRIRIDDVQHSISAYALFYENYEEFVELYEEEGIQYIIVNPNQAK